MHFYPDIFSCNLIHNFKAHYMHLKILQDHITTIITKKLSYIRAHFMIFL